jgi:hypothetical protein
MYPRSVRRWRSAALAAAGVLAASAPPAAGADVDLLSASSLRIGPAATMAAVGDVTGDGIDDVAIGREAPSSPREDSAGMVEVVPGRPGLRAVRAPRLGAGGFTIRGLGWEPDLRSAIARAGDFDGDGIGDLVVVDRVAESPRSRGESTPRGVAYVVFGSRVARDVDVRRLGSRGVVLRHGAESAAGAGDFDGDGRDDVAVGATLSDRGDFVVVVGGGPSPGTLDLSRIGARGIEIAGAPGDLGLGAALAPAGDFNGDAVSDLVVGVPNSLGRPEGRADREPIGPGAAYVVYGARDRRPLRLSALAARGVRLELPAGAMGTFGEAVAGLGDVDGDGRAEIAVGAPTYPWTWRPLRGGPGAVFVVRGGAVSGRLRMGGPGSVELRAGRPGWGFGTALAAGDLDGDGIADLVVGAPQLAEPVQFDSEPPGVVHVALGRRALDSMRLDAGSTRLVGTHGDAAGREVAVADADADGRLELLALGSPCSGASATSDYLPHHPGASLIRAGTVFGWSPFRDAAPAGLGAPRRILGTARADTIAATPAGDLVEAFGGDDRVSAGAGGDCVYAGAGGDVVSSGAGGDAVFAGPGADSVRGGRGADFLSGGAGTDALLGASGDDDLVGAQAADRLSGGPGDDSLAGGPGDDRLGAGAGDDEVGGGPGADRIAGGSGRDGVEGDTGRDRLAGGPGFDVLVGGANADAVDGGLGGDLVEGGRGRDVLRGGPGADALDAGDGRRDAVDCGAGRDVAVVDAVDAVRGCELTVATMAALRRLPRRSLPPSARHLVPDFPLGPVPSVP